MTRADVYEVNVEPVDLRHELRQGIQPCLRLPPVVARPPVAYERLDLRQLRALGPIRDRLPIGPPRSRDALAEVDEFLFRNVDLEGADCGCGGVRRRGRLRLGRLRRYSALHLRVAIARDALPFVCARERERTARQPSKALHGDLPSPQRWAPAVCSSDDSVLRPRNGERITLAAGGKVKPRRTQLITLDASSGS